MITFPIFRKDGKVMIFVPMAAANMRKAFALSNETAKKALKEKTDCNSFSENVELGATKEYTAYAKFSVVIDSKQKEGYLVKIDVVRNYADKQETVGEHFFPKKHDIINNTMELYNEAFGYEQGTKEQMEFFADLSEASVKFKTVVEFMVGHDIPRYFDLKTLSFDMAYGNRPHAFNYIIKYGVDPNNQFSEFDYLMVTIIEGKYVVCRKKIDLRINDCSESHFTFANFERFTKFLTDIK